MSDLAVELKPKSKITSEEMQRRSEALRYADAHNRIEGQYPSAEGSAIFEAFVRGRDRARGHPASSACSASAYLTFAQLHAKRRIDPQEQAGATS